MTRPKSFGHGVGKGHRGNTLNLPVIRQVPPTDWQAAVHVMSGEKGVKHFKMGRCHIMVSPPQGEHYGWHLSISCPDRYPTWDEIAKARYELLDDSLLMVMMLPDPADYVNIHNYCLHLWEEGKHP